MCGAALKASGHGSVINISSIFGTSGGFGTSPAYHAAKGAVRTLTKNVALHWATEGVRVNSIHPGFIRTPILDQARGTEVWDAMTALTPMGRLGEPEEIAAAVAYLASDDASFVTGLELYVDGATSRVEARPDPSGHRIRSPVGAWEDGQDSSDVGMEIAHVGLQEFLRGLVRDLAVVGEDLG